MREAYECACPRRPDKPTQSCVAGVAGGMATSPESGGRTRRVRQYWSDGFSDRAETERRSGRRGKGGCRESHPLNCWAVPRRTCPGLSGQGQDCWLRVRRYGVAKVSRGKGGQGGCDVVGGPARIEAGSPPNRPRPIGTQGCIQVVSVSTQGRGEEAHGGGGFIGYDADPWIHSRPFWLPGVRSPNGMTFAYPARRWEVGEEAIRNTEVRNRRKSDQNEYWCKVEDGWLG